MRDGNEGGGGRGKRGKREEGEEGEGRFVILVIDLVLDWVGERS